MEQTINFELFYRVLRDISASVHSDAKVRDVLDTVVRESAGALKARGALIRLLNLETQKLDLTASFGLSDQYLTKGLVSSQTILTDYHLENKVIIIKDVLNSSYLQYPKATWEEGIRMMIDAPLTLENNIIGILRFYFTEQREFTEEELNFVIPIAEQGAYAIQKAQLIEAHRSRYDQLALRTEKLSALGRMAAGIAHEINNPLTGILLFSSNMLKKTPADTSFKEGLEVIVQETKRCRTIIQNLLEFARESELSMVRYNINHIIEKSLHILGNEFLLKHIRVDKDLSPEVPDILLDENQIEQVFVNLLLNSLQAIEGPGVISVRSYPSLGRPGVKVEIADTGCGISPDDLPKIFDPFFSTKEKGTGLGLSVTYGIIERHQGRIDVSSQPGQGSRFILEFPIVRPASQGKV